MLNFHFKFKKNINLGNYLGNAQNRFKENNKLNKIILKLFKKLSLSLNIIHNKKNNLKYWRIIIFPWICYYVYVLYDRWKIISILKKKDPKFNFYEYSYNEDYLKIRDTEDWFKKSQNDIFNNNLFLDIIKFRKFKNKIIKKKFFFKIKKKNLK